LVNFKTDNGPDVRVYLTEDLSGYSADIVPVIPGI